MTVHMGAVEVAIFAVGCLVGTLIFKHAKDHHPGPVKVGDPAAAITAALSTMVALGLLLGVGDSSNAQQQPSGGVPPQVSISPTEAATPSEPPVSATTDRALPVPDHSGNNGE
jgi:hypothetical protein